MLTVELIGHYYIVRVSGVDYQVSMTPDATPTRVIRATPRLGRPPAWRTVWKSDAGKAPKGEIAAAVARAKRAHEQHPAPTG